MTKAVTFFVKYLPLVVSALVPWLTLTLFPRVRSWDVQTFLGWMKCLAADQGPVYTPCFPDPINYPSVGLYLSAGVMLFFQKLGFGPNEISVLYQRFLAGVDSLNLLVFYLLLRGLGIRVAAWCTLAFSLLPSTRAGASLWVQIDSVTQLFFTSGFLFALRGLTAIDRDALGKAQRYLLGLGVMISCASLTKQLSIFALPPLALLFISLTYRVGQRATKPRIALILIGILALAFSLDQAFPTPPGYYGSGVLYVLSTGSKHANILSANGGNLFSLLPGDPSRSSLDFTPLISLWGLTVRGIPRYLGIGWFIGLSTIFFLCGLRLAAVNRPLSPRGHTLYSLTFAAFLSLLMNTVLTGTHERYMYHYGFFVLPVLLTLVTLSLAYYQILLLVVIHLCIYGLFVYQTLVQSEVFLSREVAHKSVVFLNLASMLYMLVSVVLVAWSPGEFFYSLEKRDRSRMSTKERCYGVIKALSRALSRLGQGWFLLSTIIFIPYFTHFTLNIHPLFSVDLAHLFVWSLFAGLLYALAPLRQLTLLTLALPLTVLGVCEIFHAIMFQGRISVATVFVTVQTNWREVSEFTRVYFSFPVILGMLSYVVVVFWVWRGVIGRRPAPLRTLLVLFVAYLACIFLTLRGMARPLIESPGEPPQQESVSSWWPGIYGPFEDIFRALDQYESEIRAYRKEARKRKDGLVDLQASSNQTSSREVHVVVIGESTNRNHMRLYGYTRDTTPELSAKKDSIFIFSDVISAFSHTLEAVKSALTFAGADKDKKLYQVYSILDVARKAGFRTYWISNQPPIGIWDNEISVLARTADESIFVNRTGESVAACDTHSPDERVLAPFDIALHSRAHDKILIIVHLMGAHAQYHLRYPERFNVFTDPLSIPKGERPHLDEYQRKTINVYDNAVLYTDWVVSQILASVRMASQSSGSISSMVFFSDHGEEVFESRAYLGHGWDNLGRHHFEIPFIVWLSEEFERARPSTVNAIRENVTSSFMTSSLIYALIDLMSIQTPLQRPELSLFNPMYKAGSRVVYNVDYDLRLRQKP